MVRKNILICLERLDIGGVETAVLNQATTLLELGYKVVILAKKGIYSGILEQKGAICIDFEFELEYNFNLEKVQKIVQIIEKYEISEVHIHQFPCLLCAFPACVISNIPYIAYAHNSISGVYEWFMNTFSVYKVAIPYYYKYSHKIIAITDAVKTDIIQRFKIESDKIQVIHNSISFEEPDKIAKYKTESITNFLLISRFSKEKGRSIYNAIDLFCMYHKENKNAKLTIAGDGELKQEVENYIKEKEIIESTILLGAVNDVLKKINEADIVLGLDRCILEAISMKKLAIIIGYDEPKQLIFSQNIKEASQDNFSGHYLNTKTNEELVQQIKSLTPEEIENITRFNYDYAKKKLNIKKNFYTISSEEIIKKESSNAILEMLIQLQNIQNEDLQSIKNLKQEIENLKMQRIEAAKKDERIQSLEKELYEVYNSKRWKYTEKISKIFH